MIQSILLWIAKSAVILALFQFLIPIIVNGLTRNSWLKLPIMLVISIVAGAFMAWLKYTPYILFFIWLALNKYNLRAMIERTFELQSGYKINNPVFYISTYSYTFLSCFFALFFQAEMMIGSQSAGLLWRNLFGLD